MKNRILDKIAIVSSICCALHCALVPLLIGLTAWAGLRFLENPLIEWGFITVGILLAAFSLGRSVRKHQNHTPLRMAIIGAALLIFSRLETTEAMEIISTCLGSIFLVMSHAKNIMAFNVYERRTVSEN